MVLGIVNADGKTVAQPAALQQAIKKSSFQSSDIQTCQELINCFGSGEMWQHNSRFLTACKVFTLNNGRIKGQLLVRVSADRVHCLNGSYSISK